MDFVHSSGRLEGSFVKCLAALPNLHTLEIGCTPKVPDFGSFATALGGRALQVRTLVLPPTAHLLLRYCPHVEDLTCRDAAPNETFAESLVAGGLNCITKLSVWCPEGSENWDICLSTVQSHSSLTIDEMSSQEFSQGLPGLVRGFANYPSCM